MSTYLPTLVLATSMALAMGADARLAQTGDHVVVYASLADCPAFPGIIAAPEIDPDGTVKLPHLAPIPAADRTEEEILADVSHAIAARRPNGDVPPSLRISVVAQHEYLGVVDLYMASLRFLASDRCRGTPSEEQRRWRDTWMRDQETIEHLKQLERDRIAAHVHVDS